MLVRLSVTFANSLLEEILDPFASEKLLGGEWHYFDEHLGKNLNNDLTN